MNRNPGFPVSTCSIKLPEGNIPKSENSSTNSDNENNKKRQQLISFGHNQWGFKNWSWSVTKQDLDFIDFGNGKYTAGVVAFVSVSIKSLGIHREDIGYATSVSTQKGSAIHNARKSSVTNALRETLFSFGGTIATLLIEHLKATTGENQPERNTNEIKTSSDASNGQNLQLPMETKDSSSSSGDSSDKAGQVAAAIDLQVPVLRFNPAPSVAGLPANQVPRASLPTPNVSYVMQSLVPPLYSVQCAPPPVPPSLYRDAYYTEISPWPMAYENAGRHRANINLNCNVPPKNFVIDGRRGADCSRSCSSGHNPYPGDPDNGVANTYESRSVNLNASWIKPTIFYDGFWTEQKVKKWVSEQNVKISVPEEYHTPVANNTQNHMCHSKV